MSYSFKYDEIDFIIELEQVLTPERKSLDYDDWQALKRGEIAIYNFIIISKKDGVELRHIHPHQPMALDAKEKLEELETLVEDAQILEPIINQWKLELKESPGGKPPWGLE